MRDGFDLLGDLVALRFSENNINFDFDFKADFRFDLRSLFLTSGHFASDFKQAKNHQRQNQKFSFSKAAASYVTVWRVSDARSSLLPIRRTGVFGQ